MKAWTSAELKTIKAAHDARPEWVTDYELAGKLASSFNRSPESVRWQLRQLRRPAPSIQPIKILLLDIETLPIEALVWDVWKQDIHMEQIKKDWSILCYSAKWLFDSKVMGRSVTAEEARTHRDESLLPEIWNLLNEAHIVITHNGDNFDLKKLNARFFVNGFTKPMPYQSIDTKKIAVDQFALTYNKLDWIAQIVGVGRKVETEFKWWKECESGNQKYLDKMLKYNKQDVHLEEEVYLRLRPWMSKHPNVALWNMDSEIPACPPCGNTDIHWKGIYTTALGMYRAFRCEDCGAVGRSTRKKYKLNGVPTQN